MEFEISHSFDTDAATLASVLLDEGYQRSLENIGSLKERRLLSQSREPDGRVHRRIRCVLELEVSGMAKSMLGDGDPAWVEESVWRPEDSRWDWVIHPERAERLLDAKGAIEVRESDGGALRAVSGTIKVHVPLYGSRVEGWIVAGIERAYDEEAERLRALLAQS